MSREILIIEDEQIAGERLRQQIRRLRPDFQILDILQSVQSSVMWFLDHKAPDLVFMDIHLADGLSFGVFQEVEVRAPIIFTTAYNQYAIQAFKVNSIDYLLKPIEEGELEAAIKKYESHNRQHDINISADLVSKLSKVIDGKKYRHRFLVKAGSHFQHLDANDICYFYSEDGVLFVLALDGTRYIVDGTLDQIESGVNPTVFFRINRKLLIHLQSIKRIHPYLNSRLKLECQTDSKLELVVARERVASFKKWLDGLPY